MKVLLGQLKEWLELLAPFGVVFGLVWRFWLKARMDELRDLYSQIKVISEEFRPNGGSTLRDAINRIEKKITLQEQKTRAILQSLPVGTWTSDSSGKFIAINKSFCQIVKRLESEMLGDNWMNWLHADDREDVWEEWQSSIRLSRDFDSTFRFVLPDGTIQRVHAVAYQLKDEKDQQIGFLGTVYVV